jgi:hypothetical protein
MEAPRALPVGLHFSPQFLSVLKRERLSFIKGGGIL